MSITCDKGLYDALNKGVQLASGDVIGILHADDFYADKEVLSWVSAVFKDPAVEACYGDLLYVRQKADNLTDQFNIVRYWRSGEISQRKFYWGWMPPHPTFFVRKSVYEKYGLFNLDLGTASDYELMLRFLVKHRITCKYIPKILVHMRLGGVSNASVGNRLKANRMDRKAWEVNGLKPHPWTISIKPMRKIPQYFLRP